MFGLTILLTIQHARKSLAFSSVGFGRSENSTSFSELLQQPFDDTFVSILWLEIPQAI